MRPGGSGPTATPRAPLWLAHHRVAQLDRCLRLGRWRICARCAGLYPALIGVLLAEAGHPVLLPTRLALALEVALLAPALWEVARSLSVAAQGANRARVAAGAALGAVLGHAAWVAHRQGFGAPEALLPLLACSAAAVWALDRLCHPLSPWHPAARAGPGLDVSAAVQLTDAHPPESMSE